MPATEESDFRVANNGSIWTFYTFTDRAVEFTDEHIDVPDFMRMGETGFHCDANVAGDLVENLRAEGFVVNGMP